MSRYDDEISVLIEYFKKNLATHEPFSMTEEQFQSGCDGLESESLKQMIHDTFELWLSDREYELSYNQMCIAFFTVAIELEKLILVPRHPIFRLNTDVLIKYVEGKYLDEDRINVPGRITSVQGDDHVVTFFESISGEKEESRCYVIHTDDLAEYLCLA